MSDIQTFCSAVEAFLAESKWPPTRFGKEAAGDPLFVFQIRNGREPRSFTRLRVLDFIAKHSIKLEAAE